MHAFVDLIGLDGKNWYIAPVYHCAQLFFMLSKSGVSTKKTVHNLVHGRVVP